MAIPVCPATEHGAAQGSAARIGARQRSHAPIPSRQYRDASRGRAGLSGRIAPSGSGMVAGVLVLTAASLAGLVRRARVSWRATAHERTMPLPGDDLVPHPLLETTHAVTIHASRQQVWPWLVQLGQGRAGFYADSPLWDRFVDWYYRLLSREQGGAPPVGYRVGASDQIVPAWQNPRVGDLIADGPPFVTVQVNAVWGLLRQQPGLSGPPWYTTANWRAAQDSVRALARLAPRVVAPGHGPSLSGPDTARAVQAFADRFARRQSRG